MTAGYQASLTLKYEAALAALLTDPKNLERQTTLEQAAVQFATLRDGQTRISGDISLADQFGDFDRAALLRAALNRGKERANVHRETARIQEATSPTTIREEPRVIKPGLRDWRPDDPIWPNSSDTFDAIHHTRINFDDEEQIRLATRTYRTLFKFAWAAHFAGDDGSTRYPDSEREGWQWRAEAMATANAHIAGAYPARVGDLRPGQIAHSTGYPGQLLEVLATTLGPTERVVRGDGLIVPQHSVQLTWRHPITQHTRTDGPIPYSDTWLVLPNIRPALSQ